MINVIVAIVAIIGIVAVVYTVLNSDHPSMSPEEDSDDLRRRHNQKVRDAGYVVESDSERKNRALLKAHFGDEYCASGDGACRRMPGASDDTKCWCSVLYPRS